MQSDSSNLTSNLRIGLQEAQRGLYGSPEEKRRGGMTKARYRRLKKRGDVLDDAHQTTETEKVDKDAVAQQAKEFEDQYGDPRK